MNSALAESKFYTIASLLHGDSDALLSAIFKQLSGLALYWLDRHYSGSSTARGEIDTPVSAELMAIFTSPSKTNVILIGDVRCFKGRNGYPHRDDLLKSARDQYDYYVEISKYFICITPSRSS